MTKTKTKTHEPSIRCNTCGKRSYHPEDIRTRFCAHCNTFHVEPLQYTISPNPKDPTE